MNAKIQTELFNLEQHHNVTILLAIESGSRMWGFESKDSDYDVRYIYVGNPRRYVTVNPVRDVIEGPANDVLDFSGWDLKKALQLMAKSNPGLYEWLASPIRYREEGAAAAALRTLAKEFYSAREGMFHYLGMCAHNYREHMRNGSAESVRLKKYLYITRPLLCCRWLERNPNSGPPPMETMALLRDDKSLLWDVILELEQLILRKRAGEELSEGAAIPVLNNWIDSESVRLYKVAHAMPKIDCSVEKRAKLDAFLQRVVL